MNRCKACTFVPAHCPEKREHPKPMLERFLQFIQEKDLFSPQQEILLAVSGGVDSVVMGHLFHRAGFSFGIAHCNFGLRGVESDQDQAFVEQLARQWGVACHTRRFSTEAFARRQAISIQMAARHLRYSWFGKLRQTHGYCFTATAHHLDDHSETLLINMVRGTGLRGLVGIPLKTRDLLRPLLFATRHQIEEYARQKELVYREDHTNQEDKYIRNRLRLHVLPQLRQINPRVDQAFMNLSLVAHQSHQLIRKAIDDFTAQHCRWPSPDSFAISVAALLAMPAMEMVVYELLLPYGFEAPVCHDLCANLHNRQPGKLFYSPTHVCLHDRHELLVSPLQQAHHAVFTLSRQQSRQELPQGVILIENLQHSETPEFDKDNTHTAWIDADTLQYPLTLRNPLPGDYFYPLGMSGKKKISDYLTDQKIPRTSKQNIWLLCSGEKIVWVAGLRADERFKVKKSSKNILKVKFLPKSK